MWLDPELHLAVRLLPALDAAPTTPRCAGCWPSSRSCRSTRSTRSSPTHAEAPGRADGPAGAGRGGHRRSSTAPRRPPRRPSRPPRSSSAAIPGRRRPARPGGGGRARCPAPPSSAGRGPRRRRRPGPRCCVRAGLAASQGDARRQLEQGGVSRQRREGRARPPARGRDDLLHGRWVLLRKGKTGLGASLDAAPSELTLRRDPPIGCPSAPQRPRQRRVAIRKGHPGTTAPRRSDCRSSAPPSGRSTLLENRREDEKASAGDCTGSPRRRRCSRSRMKCT